MKIINPSVEIITETDPLKRIELCGRVCYKSEAKITPDSARGFVERIIRSGHTSVLEHARVKIPGGIFRDVFLAFFKSGLPYPYGFAHRKVDGCEVMTNARDFITLGGTIEQLAGLENTDDYLTVRFICDRGIANELVRHRVFSFSQESTRYVNYLNREMEFIRPVPFDWVKSNDWEPDCEDDPWMAWCEAMEKAEYLYGRMLSLGCTPQEARSVLPLSTKTELIMTGTYPQWKTMLKLRLHPAAHPQMRYLMELLVRHELFPRDRIDVLEVK